MPDLLHVSRRRKGGERTARKQPVKRRTREHRRSIRQGLSTCTAARCTKRMRGERAPRLHAAMRYGRVGDAPWVGECRESSPAVWRRKGARPARLPHVRHTMTVSDTLGSIGCGVWKRAAHMLPRLTKMLPDLSWRLSLLSPACNARMRHTAAQEREAQRAILSTTMDGLDFSGSLRGDGFDPGGLPHTV